MKTVKILDSKLLSERRTYAIFHRAVPTTFNGDTNAVLIIPDLWTEEIDPGARYLLTEKMLNVFRPEGEYIVIDELPCIDDGDVVQLHLGSKLLELVFQVNSSTNSLYVTNACNSRCQFCPQPSSADDGSQYTIAEEIIDLVEKGGECVNITGGEPTILRERFLRVIRKATEKWPTTKLFVLTNGRLLADDAFVSDVIDARCGSPLGFGIPLYSDAAAEHDRVVDVRGAFGQTIRGLLRLAAHRVEIEIRVVISKLTYQRLSSLIGFIGRNLPFVSRVVFMGLEPMGYCRERWEDFWIDPKDCVDEMKVASDVADNLGVTVLLYNFQLCCLPDCLAKKACVTISEWKRFYIDACLLCKRKSSCGGFFASQDEPRYRPLQFRL